MLARVLGCWRPLCRRASGRSDGLASSSSPSTDSPDFELGVDVLDAKARLGNDIGRELRDAVQQHVSDMRGSQSKHHVPKAAVLSGCFEVVSHCRANVAPPLLTGVPGIGFLSGETLCAAALDRRCLATSRRSRLASMGQLVSAASGEKLSIAALVGVITVVLVGVMIVPLSMSDPWG